MQADNNSKCFVIFIIIRIVVFKNVIAPPLIKMRLRSFVGTSAAAVADADTFVVDI